MKIASTNPEKYLIGRTSVIAVLLSLILFLPLVCAETIEAKLGTGITVSAKFHKGLVSQPAVVLLHGFLQSYHSEPMNTLAGNLASAGYTTLSPTISLDVNKRSQSMLCETAHTHTMNQEVKEIAHWVKWLDNKGYKNIVLVGFSSGSIQALAYTAQNAHPSIKKTILISPSPIVLDKAENQKIRALLAARKSSDKTRLEQFSLGYCKNSYVATAQDFLTYARYDDRKMLELFNQNPVPGEIILGSQDSTLSAGWVAQIKSLKTRVRIINDANHFFSDMYETDLAEAVASILKNTPVQ